MICWVIGGAIATLILVKLRRFSWFRVYSEQRALWKPDPSNWRLDTKTVRP